MPAHTSGSDPASRAGSPHPPEYAADLNPNLSAGTNDAAKGAYPRKQEFPTAYDIKTLHRRLNDYSDDELKSIPLVPEGSMLEAGATYVDLADMQPRPMTAMAGIKAGPGNYYVPKSEVDYVLWNRLTGATDPSRLDLPGGT